LVDGKLEAGVFGVGDGFGLEEGGFGGLFAHWGGGWFEGEEDADGGVFAFDDAAEVADLGGGDVAGLDDRRVVYFSRDELDCMGNMVNVVLTESYHLTCWQHFLFIDDTNLERISCSKLVWQTDNLIAPCCQS